MFVYSVCMYVYVCIKFMFVYSAAKQHKCTHLSLLEHSVVHRQSVPRMTHSLAWYSCTESMYEMYALFLLGSGASGPNSATTSARKHTSVLSAHSMKHMMFLSWYGNTRLPYLAVRPVGVFNIMSLTS